MDRQIETWYHDAVYELRAFCESNSLPSLKYSESLNGLLYSNPLKLLSNDYKTLQQKRENQTRDTK